jgi:signal transduction histidine kinase
VAAARVGGRLRLVVADSGAGAGAERLAGRPGSGLWRLRERLAVLHGGGAALAVESGDGGTRATLLLPWQEEGEGS